MTREGQPKVGANLLYDLEYLYSAGVAVTGPFYDVQVAEPLIDENARYYNLERLAKKYLGEGKREEVMYQWAAQAFGGEATRKAQAGNIWRIPGELVADYAEGDVDLPLRIFALQREALERDDLTSIFELESALIPILLGMRLRGVRVDVAKAEQLYEMLTGRVQEAERLTKGIDIYTAESIADYCRSKSIEFETTAKGNPSFVQRWLDSHSDPVIRAINTQRKATKMRDTFVKGYVLDLQVGGRLYAQFNQLKGDEYGTVSGRFSSSKPNLQNIPARDDEYGPLLRSLFVPDEGETMGGIDWSQIEFRFLTHYGMGQGAQKARDAYHDNPKTDFHDMVTALLGWAREKRKYAKNINFGLVYGMGEPLMAEQLHMTIDEVQPIFDEYHARLPFVRHTYDKVAKAASERGYIKTILGRRRRWDLYEKRYGGKDGGALPYAQAVEQWGPKVRRAYTHKALNALLQGSAADMMKKAMVDIHRSGVLDVLGWPLLTVHDELVFSVPQAKIGAEALTEVKHLMETTIPLKVPVIAELKTGRNWSECK